MAFGRVHAMGGFVVNDDGTVQGAHFVRGSKYMLRSLLRYLHW